ncbi:hypothetical protein Verru16b_01087 [Lacunisphaera limnophila]|uniref:Uncharacterized protein n=2 Tax=Lacunisphaera limnophila TaxID=1838286 RepID=A0A1D8AT56_9BACT|nr:hypothetical protein Verru16b_01087 [Lacunisphaera limnophila]
MPVYAPYKFGSMSAALLGVSLSSDGKIVVFARQRAAAPTDGAAAPAMKDLFRSAPLALSGKGTVDFTLSLKDKNITGTPKEALAMVAPRIWPRLYPGLTYFSLGAHDPLGAIDIDFAAFGPVQRPANISSNRSLSFTFHYDPQAANPRQRAVLELKDKDSGGLLNQRYEFAGLDNLPAAPAGLLVTIQVDPANYDDGCATLEFTSAQQVSVTRSDTGAVVSGLSKVVLNTSSNPA